MMRRQNPQLARLLTGHFKNMDDIKEFKQAITFLRREMLCSSAMEGESIAAQHFLLALSHLDSAQHHLGLSWILRKNITKDLVISE